MSFFGGLNKRRLTKRRDELSEEARTFIQVHFVRERGSERYAFNTLTLKDDPDRIQCEEWYNEHGNPVDFSDALACHLKDKNIDISKISGAYHLDSKLISRLVSEHDFVVSKGDAIAICLGLKLNLAHTRYLLKLAGYALTNSSDKDLAIRYCIENGYISYGDVNYILNDICQTRLKDIA